MKIYRSVVNVLARGRSVGGNDARTTLFIVLRQSPDWENLTPLAFQEQSRRFCRLIGRPIEQINEAVALWDATFGISFLQTRQAMKDISLENFKAVKASLLVDLNQVIDGGTGPGIYLFTDDDDWISPDILEALNRCARPQRSAFVWGSAVFGTGPRALTLRALDSTCYTNNYGVDSSYFENRPERLSAVSQHWEADIAVDKQEFCQVNEYLTMTNKHPSSTLFLERALKGGASPGALVRAIARYRNRLDSLDVPQPVSWATPCMLQVKAFCARLLESAR